MQQTGYTILYRDKEKQMRITLNMSLQEAYKMKAEEHLLLGIYGACNESDLDSRNALKFNGNSPQNE